jgi:hypothetical protein
MDKPTYNLVSQPYLVGQLELYRFARTVEPEEFKGLMPIADFYESALGHTGVGKRVLGRLVVAALDYNPRHLKGATVELGNKITSCYSIAHPLALAYGLEWMLGTWYRKFFNSVREPDDQVTSLEAEFDFLANASPEEWKEVISWVPQIEQTFVRIDWDNVWKTLGWKPSDNVRLLEAGDSTGNPRLKTLPVRKRT